MVQATDIRSRVLVLAPTGRDAAAALDQLRAASLSGIVCAGVVDLIGKLEEGAGVAVIAEEAFRNDFAKLTEWVAKQPPWSDYPFIIISSRHFVPKDDARRINLLEIIGQRLAAGAAALRRVSHERHQVGTAGAAAAR